ncbi:MAG: TldD/PmbA family protein [Candidatus Nanohaloarchaea archaeon]|nr:TldD/PmbA family protein [Candidatus Nanohaloarchaea archaeon]
MIEKMRKALEAKGYDQIEVYAEEEKAIDCQVSKDRIDNVETENLRGVGIRALVDNKVGFSYTTDPEDIRRAAEKAIKLAKLSQTKIISLPVSEEFPGVKDIFDKDTAETSEEEITESTKNAISTDRASISEGSVSRVVGKSYILNSCGIESSQRSTYFATYFSANKDGQSKYRFHTRRSKYDPKYTVKKAVDLLEDSLNPQKIEGGKKEVVLTPNAQYQIFSGILYPAFNAERVQRGKSPFQNQLEEQVASESMDITDQGTLDGGVNTRRFDREGTASRDTSLIKDGILKNYLYDIKRAEKDSVKSTGNATGGYSSPPKIQPTNMVLKGEKGSKEEIDEAIIIDSVAGVHTANKTSGDFSLNITTGFKLEEGEKTPIEGGLFVSNIFDLLKNHKFFYGDRSEVVSLVTRNAVFRDQKIVV